MNFYFEVIVTKCTCLPSSLSIHACRKCTCVLKCRKCLPAWHSHLLLGSPSPVATPKAAGLCQRLPLTTVGRGRRQAFWTQLHRLGDLLRPAAKGPSGRPPNGSSMKPTSSTIGSGFSQAPKNVWSPSPDGESQPSMEEIRCKLRAAHPAATSSCQRTALQTL